MIRFFKRKKSLFVLILLIFLLSACSQSSSDTAPPFELPDLDGNTVSLEELTSSGERVYVKFWTSWCDVCRDGLDDLEKLTSQDLDFTVLTIIHPGYNAEKSTLDKFLQWYEPLGYENIPILVDEEGEWTSEFQVMAYPTSFYIDEDMNISEPILGNQTNEEIIETIENLK